LIIIIITIIIYCNLFLRSGEVWRGKEGVTRGRNISRRSVAPFVTEIVKWSDESEKERRVETEEKFRREKGSRRFS